MGADEFGVAGAFQASKHRVSRRGWSGFFELMLHVSTLNP